MAALPVLYTFRRCPYAMRARLAIEASGLQVEHREVVLRNKPAEMLAASPKGTVPVLVLPGDEVIDESLDVMLWALRQNDPQQWLASQRTSFDDMLTLVAGNDGSFKHSLDRYKYPNRYPEEASASQADFAVHHRNEAAHWLAQLDARLGDGWLSGARASVADMAILPFIRQFAHTDPDWFAAQPWARLKDWLTAFEGSTLFASVMAKHPPWQPGST